MNAPRGGEVGAELAELYLKGKNELATDVAGQFSAASAELAAVTVYSAMTRDGNLGNPISGPYYEFSMAKSALQRRLDAMHDQLETLGHNVMKTAQQMADVDEATAKAFRNHGGEFPG